MSRFKVHKNQILVLLALAQFMVVLDASIVNMALPSIRNALHFQPNDLQWVVTAYTLCFGGFLLFGGRSADLFGRKRLFISGVAAFTVASLIAGLSQSSTMLIVARAVQGLTAAFMSPAALSIVLNTFREGKERNKALGVWGGVAAGGAATGVLLGGVLTEYLSWRWNFFVNVPVGAAVAFAAIKLIPESKTDLPHRHLDLPGAVSVTAGLMLLVFALTKAPTYGWESGKTLSALVVSAILLVFFVINEKRSKQPLVPLDIFRTRNLSAANLVILPVFAGMFAMFFFISIYVQTVLNFSPVKSGLGFLPVTIVIGISSAIVSNLVGKFGFKPFMVIAPLFTTAGLLVFHRLPVHGSYLHDVLPGLVLIALGMGFTFVSVTIAATSGVPHSRSGLASGILNTSQQIGGALGLAILSGVFASRLKDNLQHGFDPVTAQVTGFHTAFIVASGFTISASIIALLLVKQSKADIKAAAQAESTPAA